GRIIADHRDQGEKRSACIRMIRVIRVLLTGASIIFALIQVLKRFLRLLKRGQREISTAAVSSRSQKPKENKYEWPEYFHNDLQTLPSDPKNAKKNVVRRFGVGDPAGGAPGATRRAGAARRGGVRPAGRPGRAEFARRIVGADRSTAITPATGSITNT